MGHNIAKSVIRCCSKIETIIIQIYIIHTYIIYRLSLFISSFISFHFVLMKTEILHTFFNFNLKVALITYKTLLSKKNGLSLGVAVLPICARTLRSSSSYRLHVDVPKTVFAGRAFRFAAPKIWNSLPNYLTDFSLSLDNFKQKLKTYLFDQAYRH